MPSPQLPNYLLANRKRVALSQDEVAFLLGGQSGTMMSRHERFAIEPTLRTALAYEVIYKRSVSELFDGTYQKIEREVAERAKMLLDQNSPSKSTARSVRKQAMLTALAGI